MAPVTKEDPPRKPTRPTMTADEFRAWVHHSVVAAVIIAAVVLAFPTAPLWVFALVALFLGVFLT